MANIKLSDLPLVASPATDATVVGINNGAASRFAYVSEEDESAVPWESTQFIDVNVIINNGLTESSVSYKSFTYDFSSVTFNEKTLYIPRMKFSDTDKTTYSPYLDYLDDKIIYFSTKHFHLGNPSPRVNCYRMIIPITNYPIYILYDVNPDSNYDITDDTNNAKVIISNLEFKVPGTTWPTNLALTSDFNGINPSRYYHWIEYTYYETTNILRYLSIDTTVDSKISNLKTKLSDEGLILSATAANTISVYSKPLFTSLNGYIP